LALTYKQGSEVAELACLSVSNANENMGIGQKLMLFAEDAARNKGVKKSSCCRPGPSITSKQKGGYKDGQCNDLPSIRREKYEASGRNSRFW